MYLIKNVDIFDGQNILTQKSVYVSQGKILGLCPVGKSPSFLNKDCIFSFEKKNLYDGAGQLLVPGFIDIQVNGGGGAFFNQDPSVGVLKKIQRAHLHSGTTSFLPTFISDSFLQTKKAMQAVKEASAQGLQGILGLHLEGPYLNTQKNGIHLKEHIRQATAEEIEDICAHNLNILLVTLAPENMKASDIQKMVQKNIVVFAGHTNATFEQMQHAFAQGVTGITHFFNACSPFLSRAPGVVGAGLMHDGIWCGLIADGLHVDYNAIKVAFKCKGTHHFILVSDAMTAVGTNMSEFFIQGQKITVTDGKYVDDFETLAGSSLTVHQAFKNILAHDCATLPAALAMTSTHAAQCLRIDHSKGRVAPGYDADLVLMDKTNFDILTVIQNGEIVHEHSQTSRDIDYGQ